MEHYLIPTIQKKPSNIISHVRANDAKNLASRTVVDNLLKLETLGKDSSPTCKVFISTPTFTNNGESIYKISFATKDWHGKQ